MSLRFRRNYPLLLGLLAMLAFLTLVAGDQPITAYSFRIVTPQSAQIVQAPASTTSTSLIP